MPIIRPMTPPTPQKPPRHLQLSDLRAAAQLASQATVGVVRIAEGVHQAVWRTLGAPQGAQIIDGGGRALMPGLIDAHWHSLMAAMSMQQLLMADPGLVQLAAGAEALAVLMQVRTEDRARAEMA